MKKILFAAAMAFVCSTAIAQNLKFAHVNFQEIFQLVPEMDKIREQMATMTKDNEDEVKLMYDEYQSKYQEYQQKASTWTEAIRDSKEKALVELQQRIQDVQQTMQQEMQTIYTNKTTPIMQKCQEEINKVAKAGGYIFVLDTTLPAVVYVDPKQSDDLTPAVRKALGIPEGRTLEALQKELQEKAQAAAAQQ